MSGLHTDDTESVSGTLYVVATPIGNLADISARALDILQSVALVAAEDTRHSQRLFSHYDVRCDCIPYHEHSEEKTAQRVINVLLAGDDVALISDAGTPLISDPGFRLIRRLQDRNITVSPVPGPSALIAALSVSGLPTDSFVFAGFLPAKSGARKNRLEAFVAYPHTLIFYEAPHRILACLQDMAEVLGGARTAVLARELTKRFETVRKAPLTELVEWVASDSNQQRGELVVLLEGANVDEATNEVRQILSVLLAELPLKQAVSLAAKLSGAKKNEVYSTALAISKPDSKD
ncbi:MAG: 16S rRNA (cytidine(1402)-2'-O)-methyltransferase [Pseudomonadales bacterium]